MATRTDGKSVTTATTRTTNTTSTAGDEFVEKTTLKEILNISNAAMDQAMGIAYQLYLSRRFAEAETVCRGLIACDHRYWWSHSLHASVLRRLGREEEALRAVDDGLKYEPGQAKLALMRAELLIAIARKRLAPPPAGNDTGVVAVAGVTAAVAMPPRPSVSDVVSHLATP